MERKMQDVTIKEGNTIELSERILKHLDVVVGEEIKCLFTDDAIILMKSSKFGEILLEKIHNN